MSIDKKRGGGGNEILRCAQNDKRGGGGVKGIKSISSSYNTGTAGLDPGNFFTLRPGEVQGYCPTAAADRPEVILTPVSKFQYRISVMSNNIKYIFKWINFYLIDIRADTLILAMRVGAVNNKIESTES